MSLAITGPVFTTENGDLDEMAVANFTNPVHIPGMTKR
jgi:hypothetical protein